MTDKTLEQGAVLYEFDAQSYSLFGKPLETDHVLIVRMEDGRARFTMRELTYTQALREALDRRNPVALERQLEQLAYSDPLTGLANRALFTRQLAAMIEGCAVEGRGGAAFEQRAHQHKFQFGRQCAQALRARTGNGFGAIKLVDTFVLAEVGAVVQLLQQHQLHACGR